MNIKTLIAALSLSFVALSPSFAADEPLPRMNCILENWQAHNVPILFIKEQSIQFTDKADVPRYTRPAGVDGADDVTRLIVGTVEISTDATIKAGTLVLMAIHAGEQACGGYGEGSYWIVAADALGSVIPLNKDATALYMGVDFTYVWNGNNLRIRPDLLSGVWKQMLDKVLAE